MTVVLGKLCTVCHAKGELTPAVNVARNAVGLEWYECAAHGVGDHSKAFETGLMRIHVESAEAYFRRMFPNARRD